MKIEMFGKEREITLKDCLIVIGEILLLYGFIELQVYFDAQANAEGMAKMQAAIPAVVSMDVITGGVILMKRPAKKTSSSITKVNFKNMDGSTSAGIIGRIFIRREI